MPSEPPPPTRRRPRERLSVRLPSARQARSGALLALPLLLAGAGLLLIADRAGLDVEYFALAAPWEGRPFTTGVGEPSLDSASEVGDALMTKVAFSVRWRGWWDVERAGEHRFSLVADDGGYLRVDDDLVVDTGGLFGEPRESGVKALEPGFHAVEIGLYQTYGESGLAVHWAAPGATGETTAPLPVDALYAGRPLVARKVLRRALAGWPRPGRQLLGVLLLTAALLLVPGLATRFAGTVERLRSRLPPLTGPGPRTVLLLVLFALAFFSSLPYTGTVQGGDDTAYLFAAKFGGKFWFFNRYGHVYLLKLFTALSGGDPFTGVRVWWSFAFATTVAALAVAARSVGPGLQLRTLAAALFVLAAQNVVFGSIGAGFADYSAMMFVTAAVAVCMHGLAVERRRPPPRHEWHALAIGALTVAAFRSKEVGAVLLLLPLLFLVGDGGVDLRRFARKTAYWIGGALAVLVTLMLLDGWLVGDFLFTLDPGRMAQSRGMNFPAGLPPRGANESWLHTIWSPSFFDANLALRNLWLGVVAAALAAGLRRRRLELRLLHLLPIAYLLALIALYIRMPHPFSPRMLIPILPMACLLTALLLNHAGLDEVPWRQALRPAVLVPTALAAATVLLVVVPYRLETLDPASLLPVDLLSRYGWQPDRFVAGVLLPAVALSVLGALVLVVHRRRARVAALLVAFLLFFGVGFEVTRTSLTRNWTAQRSALMLHPWRSFREQLDATAWDTIALSRDLRSYFRMVPPTTGGSVASLALDRTHFRVFTTDEVPVDVDAAIASQYVYDEWRQRLPELAATASVEPSGFLVLVRPKEAAERAGGRLGPRTGNETARQGLPERLEQLKLERDPVARAELLREILDHLEGPDRVGRAFDLRFLRGERLRAVGLSPDGWTDGVEPAGLILKNTTDGPLVEELLLTVRAPASYYPIRIYVDDGETVETVRFDKGRTRRIRLRSVPRGESRLVLVWSDKAWPPRKESDPRQLGVRIRPAPPG